MMVLCPLCRAETAGELTRLPDGRFACLGCWRTATEAEFTGEELATISRYCQAVVDHLSAVGEKWNSAAIRAAMDQAQADAGMDTKLFVRWWNYSRLDFEWHCGEPGESIQ